LSLGSAEPGFWSRLRHPARRLRLAGFLKTMERRLLPDLYLHSCQGDHAMSSPRDADQNSQQPADAPKNPVSKPIGDAIPTPIEPGLDQPLPEKEADEPVEKKP
jgi:hypothetical protein